MYKNWNKFVYLIYFESNVDPNKIANYNKHYSFFGFNANPKNYKELFSGEEEKIKMKEIGKRRKGFFEFKEPKFILYGGNIDKILITEFKNQRVQILNSKNYEFLNFIGEIDKNYTTNRNINK